MSDLDRDGTVGAWEHAVPYLGPSSAVVRHRAADLDPVAVRAPQGPAVPWCVLSRTAPPEALIGQAGPMQSDAATVEAYFDLVGEAIARTSVDDVIAAHERSRER